MSLGIFLLILRITAVGAATVGFPFSGSEVLFSNENNPSFVVEICNNGIDDDGDGFMDCVDPDCQFFLSAIPTHSTCAGVSNGAVNLTVSGGTAPFSFLWSNGAITEDVSNLPAGTYSVTITSAGGCTQTGTYILQNAANMNLSATVTDADCYGLAPGAINLTVFGGTSPYTFSWSNGVMTEDLTGLGAGVYGVTVTDVNGCTAASYFTVSSTAGGLETYFIPMPDDQIHKVLKNFTDYVNMQIGSEMKTIISIVATEDNTVIYYDHWEDGYEADVENPTQSTTQIWGDGNNANGKPPGYTSDQIDAGDVIGLVNLVPLPRNPSQIRYDGRDRVSANYQLAVTRAAWAPNPGPVLSGAVEIVEKKSSGLFFEVPVGQNIVADAMFELTALFVMAQEDFTIVTIDTNGDLLPDITKIMNKGESYLINGGVNAGTKITALRPVQVSLITGDLGGLFETRFFALFPQEKWDNCYYASVGTTDPFDPAHVFIYNPNSSAITVNYQMMGGNGSFSVPAKGSYRFKIANQSGVHFYTNSESQKFCAVSTIDSDKDDNDAHDWGYTLVPESYLTVSATIGWGPGNEDLSGNGSPAWVTATKVTKLYVDYDGNPDTGPLIDPLGHRYNVSYNLQAFESKRIFDPNDNDQTGMYLYTLDGTLIAAAWGQDPATADPGNPYLDFGTTVPPIRKMHGWKEYELVTDNNGNGLVDPGDKIRFKIILKNAGNAPVYGITLTDPLPPEVTYVANSSRLNGSFVPDNATGSPFPIDELGYYINIIPVNAQYVFSYETLVKTPPPVFNQIVNTFTAIVNVPCQTITGEVVVPVVEPPATSVCSLSFTDVGGGSVTSYPVNSQICLSVTDDDQNTNASSKQTIQVTIQNAVTGDTETLTLTETGNNTGVFRACITSSDSGGQASQNGTLYATGGNGLTATFTDAVHGDVCSDQANLFAPGFYYTKQLYLSTDGSGSPDQDLDRVDPAATGDGTTAVTASINNGTTTTFTQVPSMCSDFKMPVGAAVGAKIYITVTSGTMPANPAVTAVLKYGSTTIATLSNPVYSSGLLTFSGGLASAVTVPAGQAVVLQITSNQGGVSFQIQYDSQTKPSHIDLPTTSVITVDNLAIYDAPYAGGSAITSATVGDTVYVRSTVSDPFGYADITQLSLKITSPGNGLASYSMPIVNSAGCSRTFEYPWIIPAADGGYNLAVIAYEGYENTIFDTVTTVIPVDPLDPVEPCDLTFRSNNYELDNPVCVELADFGANQDDYSTETVLVQVTSSGGDSENILLTETGPATGVFEGCINSSSTAGQSGNNGLLYAPPGNTLNIAHSSANGGLPCADNATVTAKAPFTKVLYLTTPGQGLDRIDPVATNDTSTAAVNLGGGCTGTNNLTLTTTGDAMLYQTNPTTNYGNNTNFQVGAFSAGGTQNLHSVLKFDVSALAGQTVCSAVLKVEIRSTSSAPIPVEVLRLAKDWTELSVTWNSPWTTPGGDFDATVFGSTTMTQVLSLGEPTFTMTIDITALVKGWVDGTYPNYGLILRDPDYMARSISCWGKEGSVAPKLTVTY